MGARNFNFDLMQPEKREMFNRKVCILKKNFVTENFPTG